MATSDPSSPTTNSTPRIRRRARTACLPCRHRKRKCDSNLPCNMCGVYGYNCEYPRDSRQGAKKHPEGQLGEDGRQSMTVNAGAKAIQQHLAVARDASVADMQLDPSASGKVASGSGSSPTTQQGILDPFKSRYMSRHSAIAFPRSLGIDLQSARPPPLHSFAYNCGVRPEEKASVHSELLALVSVEELNRYSAVYFSVVHPFFGLLDQQQFMKRCDTFLGWGSRNVVSEAIISGVVALGSFFSLALGHPKEAEIVYHAKSILDDPAVARVLSPDHVVASILRVIYLRATTRPHLSWMQSCTTLHLVEATGLHHERHAVLLTTDNTNASEPLECEQEAVERARRIFWFAWALHVIISYEYGRSSIVLSITCNLPLQDSNIAVIQIAQLLPKDNATASSAAQRSEIDRALERLLTISDSHPMVSLTKADVCFCFYRRLHMSKTGIAKSFIDSIIHLGNNGLEAAHALAQDARPWWSVLHVPFQYICVLIAIDRSESLVHIARAMEILEKIARLLGTHLALEALSTAKLLIRDSKKKKRLDLKLLEEVYGVDEDISSDVAEQENQVQFNWDEIFGNGSYGMFPPISPFTETL